MYFTQYFVLSKRTHQTDNHSPKCQAIHNMHIAQLVKNKNSMLCTKKKSNDSKLLELMGGGECFGSLVDVEKVLE